MTYYLVAYDVWGNAEDGYDVNDVYRYTDITYEVPDDATDESVIEQLKTEIKEFPRYPYPPIQNTFLNKSADVALEWSEDFIEVFAKEDDYPCGRLEVLK